MPLQRKRVRERERREYLNSILPAPGTTSRPVPTATSLLTPGQVSPSAPGSVSESPPGFVRESHSLPPTATDKTNSAARMAQELASQSSWADTYVPTSRTPNTLTPVTSATPEPSVLGQGERHQDTFEPPPPSYEESRAAQQMPSASSHGQPRQNNVRAENPGPFSENTSPSFHPDVESGERTPLLPPHVVAVVRRKRKTQKRFFIIFLTLALWLMGLQAIKGIATGFWCTDGTPIPPLPQRNFTQHERSQPISGTFTFYDSLDLSTMSGSINIVIDPQPSNVTGVIRIASKSGSIKVKFSDDYVQRMRTSGKLDRTFDIQVKTTSASQTLELPQGNGGTVYLHSIAGSITATLLTASLGRADPVSTLITETTSGSQKISVKPTSPDPIIGLAAKHYVKGSASTKVAYPPSWDGMVHASIGGSGSLDVKGNNLHFQHNGNKEVYAWRLRGDEGQDDKRQGQVVEVRCDASGSVKVDLSAL